MSYLNKKEIVELWEAPIPGGIVQFVVEQHFTIYGQPYYHYDWWDLVDNPPRRLFREVKTIGGFATPERMRDWFLKREESSGRTWTRASDAELEKLKEALRADDRKPN